MPLYCSAQERRHVLHSEAIILCCCRYLLDGPHLSPLISLGALSGPGWYGHEYIDTEICPFFALWCFILSYFLRFGRGYEGETCAALFFVLIIFLTALYAVSDEYHQSFIAGRYPSSKDVIIDAFGAATFFSFVYLWKNRKNSIGASEGISKNEAKS